MRLEPAASRQRASEAGGCAFGSRTRVGVVWGWGWTSLAELRRHLRGRFRDLSSSEHASVDRAPAPGPFISSNHCYSLLSSSIPRAEYLLSSCLFAREPHTRYSPDLLAKRRVRAAHPTSNQVLFMRSTWQLQAPIVPFPIAASAITPSLPACLFLVRRESGSSVSKKGDDTWQWPLCCCCRVLISDHAMPAWQARRRQAEARRAGSVCIERVRGWA